MNGKKQWKPNKKIVPFNLSDWHYCVRCFLYSFVSLFFLFADWRLVFISDADEKAQRIIAIKMKSLASVEFEYLNKLVNKDNWVRVRLISVSTSSAIMSHSLESSGSLEMIVQCALCIYSNTLYLVTAWQNYFSDLRDWTNKQRLAVGTFYTLPWR